MPDTRTAASLASTGKLPPGPGGLGLGRLRHRFRDGLGFCEQLQRDYGDIVYFRMLSQRFCLVSSPELIEEVLATKGDAFGKGPFFKRTDIIRNPTSLTADGEAHRRVRKLLQPSFASKALNGYGEVMIEEALRLQADWQGGDTVDIAAEVNQMALNIAARIFFGTDERIPAHRIQDILKAMAWTLKLTVLPLGRLIGGLSFLPQNRHRRRAVAAMDEVVYRVIGEARRAADERTDLISFLVRATDQDGFDQPLSDAEIRDESYILIVAGHETTASTIAWCFYYLSRNPEARERLEEEVDRVLGGRPPTPADYRRFEYARAVFDETLRLTPPIFVLSRSALEDCDLGGYRIPRGTVVHAFLRHPQRSDLFFPEADTFEPQRWLETPAAERPRYAYLPFGGGARNCVGAGFGKMEGVFTLASICRRWRLDVVSPEFPEVTTLALYRFRHGLPVRLRRRQP